MSNQPLHPFPYDPFQQRAIAAIDRDVSLFVAAPTGAGKTVLADYVIEHTLARHRRIVYTAPVKALSNQKFRDFTARHGDAVGIIPRSGGRPEGPRTSDEDVRPPPTAGDRQVVGIMTGDVTINPTAPLLIMTTEIYRNTLLEDPERLSRASWIIFDEIHYLDDPERGTVWEEAILFTPPHINLLCLSATIPNVEELARWIREVHQRPVEVIEETHRPVPLSILFQCQNAIHRTLDDLKRVGFEEPARALAARRPIRGAGRHARRSLRSLQERPNRLDRLVQDLIEHRRLPCILFTFGRRRAEDLASECSGFSLLAEDERSTLRTMFQKLCAQFQLGEDRTAQAMGQLIERGVAYHHAGMLPTMKEVIERCFQSRLIKLIVTTETFALGINMPARSVVLDALKKRSGGGYTLLSRRAFLQMAGRAGRRGMDEEGFAYLRVNPAHVAYQEVARLLQGPPEPVRSRFNTSYATLLNLYRRHGRGLLDVFPKTLYAFQTTGAQRAAGRELMERKLELLQAMGYLIPSALTAKGLFASWLYGYELLLTELHTRGALDTPDPLALAILIAAIVYEPRPGMSPPKSHRLARRLDALCQEPLARIHAQEHRFRVHPRTKAPAFHLTRAIEAWMSGAPFATLTTRCEVDEGEIVRYFRMTVQLLRQLAEIPGEETSLHAAAAKAMGRINRDLIDAEAQLRMGSWEG